MISKKRAQLLQKNATASKMLRSGEMNALANNFELKGKLGSASIIRGKARFGTLPSQGALVVDPFDIRQSQDRLTLLDSAEKQSEYFGRMNKQYQEEEAKKAQLAQPAQVPQASRGLPTFDDFQGLLKQMAEDHKKQNIAIARKDFPQQIKNYATNQGFQLRNIDDFKKVAGKDFDYNSTFNTYFDLLGPEASNNSLLEQKQSNIIPQEQLYSQSSFEPPKNTLAPIPTPIRNSLDELKEKLQEIKGGPKDANNTIPTIKDFPSLSESKPLFSKKIPKAPKLKPVTLPQKTEVDPETKKKLDSVLKSFKKDSPVNNLLNSLKKAGASNTSVSSPSIVNPTLQENINHFVSAMKEKRSAMKEDDGWGDEPFGANGIRALLRKQSKRGKKKNKMKK